MGYDLTLHPISDREINHFILEPLYNQDLVSERIKELSSDSRIMDFLHESYEHAYTLQDNAQHYSAATQLGNLAACVSSFLYPYWYSRNVCLSFLIQDQLCPQVFTPLADCAKDAKFVKRVRQPQLLIDENYMCSGFAAPHLISDLADQLIPSLEQKAKQMKQKQLGLHRRSLMAFVSSFIGSKQVDVVLDTPLGKVEDLLASDNLWGVTEALKYCKAHGLGLIEASDLVVPISDSYGCNPDNIRASFLSNGD
jgi:hypothetical protein